LPTPNHQYGSEITGLLVDLLPRLQPWAFASNYCNTAPNRFIEFPITGNYSATKELNP